MWSLLLFTLVGLSAVGYVWIRLREKGRTYLHIVLSGSILAFLASQWTSLSWVPEQQAIAAGLHMAGLTLLMMWVTTAIWHLKPVYARYPFAFTYSPLLLNIGFPWISWVPSLMDLFLLVIEFGILLILFLLWWSLKKSIESSVWFLSVLFVGLLLWSSHFYSQGDGMIWMAHVGSSVLVLLVTLLYEQLVGSLSQFQQAG